jgi:hypothetical protein
VKSINSFLLTTIINDWLEDEVLSIWSLKYIWGQMMLHESHSTLLKKDNGVCTSTAAAAIIWWSRSRASWRKRMLLHFVHIHLKILILFISFLFSKFLFVTLWSIDSLFQFLYTMLLLLLLWELLLQMLLGTYLLLLSLDCLVSKKPMPSLSFTPSVVWNDDFESH